MNVSEYIFYSLSQKGIDTAFLITGGQAMYLDDAVGKNRNFKVICHHHEQAAAMAAEAYGRIKNKPAVTLVTAGPGSVNALNGVVGGYTDSSPMIIISGQAALSFVKYQDKTQIRQYGVQGINIKPLVEDVTKYFVTVDDPQKIEYYIGKAYYKAITGRPGPVWIDVPLDVQNMQVDTKFLEAYIPDKEDNSIHTVRAVEKMYELLGGAHRPVLLVGQGVSLAGAREEFYKFANQIRIPVITARLGIDLIESENDLYVGRPGNYGERAANFAIQGADVIISVGCRLASSLVGHDAKNFGKNAIKLVVDIDQKELDKPGPDIDYKYRIDCKDFFIAALDQMDFQSKFNFEEWVSVCNHWKKTYPVVLSDYKDETPVNSYYFIDRLSKFADTKDLVLIDTGSCFHVACQTWKVKKGQRYLTTGGLSSMGYWCAGIGACLASGTKKTIIVTGDGSLQMNIQEFATIKYNNLPIKTFILNNNGYLLIRHTQHNFMNNRFIGESPASGVWCPDSLEIAKAYGIKGIRIESVSEVDDKVKEALEFDGPVICEVMTPSWQLLIPRITSDRRSDGKLVSKEYDDMFPFLSVEELNANREMMK